MILKRIELVNLLPIDPIAVEVGCAESNFSRDLLNAGVSKLYSVDVWTHIPNVRGDGNSAQEWHDANFENTKKLLSPFGDRSIILKGHSVEMAKMIPDSSLDLVYIDSDHSLEGVTNDINSYWPKLKSGGIMGFHDYEMPEYGVKESVTHFAKLHNLEIHLIPETEIKDAGAFLIKP